MTKSFEDGSGVEMSEGARNYLDLINDPEWNKLGQELSALYAKYRATGHKQFADKIRNGEVDKEDAGVALDLLTKWSDRGHEIQESWKK